MEYQSADYGAILYERFGAVRFGSAEKLYPEFDMSKLLRSLNCTESSNIFGRKPEERLAAFAAWKESTLHARRIGGLDSNNTADENEENGRVQSNS